MATVICLLSAVIILLLALTAYLAVALFWTTEELKSRARRGLYIPEPVKWDYTKEKGWDDAEVDRE